MILTRKIRFKIKNYLLLIMLLQFKKINNLKYKNTNLITAKIT
jgi:hypothetical protein